MRVATLIILATILATMLGLVVLMVPSLPPAISSHPFLRLPRSSCWALAWLVSASGVGSGVGKRSKPRLETRALDLTTPIHGPARSNIGPALFFAQTTS